VRGAPSSLLSASRGLACGLGPRASRPTAAAASTAAVSALAWRSPALRPLAGVSAPTPQRGLATAPLPKPQSPEAPAEKKVSRIRQLWRKYGYVFVGTYGSVYLLTLGSLYTLMSRGIIGGADAISYVQSLGLDRLIHADNINPKAGNFAIAWVLTKFTEPIRLGVTIVATPIISRALGLKVADEAAQMHKAP
jgi:hypothetical protein